MRKFPRLPKALLKTPLGFKKPKVSDFKTDMQHLGEEIAEDFKETVIANIEENNYNFENAPSTVKQKGSDTPLINTQELVDSIYREGTVVSVENTPRDDSPLTNLELAMVLEYGTKDRHIPARPVWRNTYRDFKEEAREKVEEFFKLQKSKKK